MTLIRTVPAVTPFRRGGAHRAGHRWHVNPASAIAVAVFLAVLIADALLIAMAAPRIADLGSLYVSST